MRPFVSDLALVNRLNLINSFGLKRTLISARLGVVPSLSRGEAGYAAPKNIKQSSSISGVFLGWSNSYECANRLRLALRANSHELAGGIELTDWLNL